MNVLDELPQSYWHKKDPKFDQTKYIVKTKDHQYVDLEVAKLFSRVYLFCEEEGHVIMDCLFVPFHIRADIVKHVELQNVAKTLMDQSHEQK